MGKYKHWIWLFFAVIALIARFFYGRRYEIKNGEFTLSGTGILLTLVILFFFGIFMFFEVIKKVKD
jgi:hypothetical protein